MKKMLSMITVLIIALSLFSCNKTNSDTPEGLQIVKKSEHDGFIFYGPENWSVVNTDQVAAAKVSPVNNTSITFVEAKMPLESIPEYFEKSLSQFPESIRAEMKITLRDKECSFGNADGEAYKYVYTYKYDGYDFACMQILLTNGDRFYIFTYTSYGDVTDESSYYRTYLDSVQLSIDNFRFTERKGSSDKPSYTKDSDGYILASDKKLSGFELYLPECYEVVYSDGFVKARTDGGASIVMSKATTTGIGIIKYLELRKEQLGVFTTDFVDLKMELGTEFDPESAVFDDWKFDVMPEYNKDLCLGDLHKNGIIAYEYKYSFNGKAYQVYQVMGVDNFNGYVFTFTAPESEYSDHIEEIKVILEKVKF